MMIAVLALDDDDDDRRPISPLKVSIELLNRPISREMHTQSSHYCASNELCRD